MKILLLTNLFAPDALAGASLYSDMALYFDEQGHDVRVLTTFSYYPSWSLSAEDIGVRIRDEVWNEIPVRRVSMYVPRKPSGLKRILSDISFFKSILSNRFENTWLPDIVITACPMFSQCLAQRFLYAGKRVPRFIIVQDFVVDAALELGILKIPGLDFPLRKLERWSFRSAQTLSTISHPMLDKLREIVGSDRRLLYIPNWIHASLQNEIDRQIKQDPLRKSNVLFYSGNLGVKQGLPDFLKNFFRISSNWVLEIHGGGADRARLENDEEICQRVSLGDVLDEPSYVNKLLTTSASLITQAAGVGANFLPSKLLPAIATGTPVLAVCDEETPLGREVRAGNFGVVVAPNDLKGLEEVLSNWQESPAILQQFSANALLWAKKFRRGQILKQYENEMQSLVEDKSDCI